MFIIDDFRVLQIRDAKLYKKYETKARLAAPKQAAPKRCPEALASPLAGLPLPAGRTSAQHLQSQSPKPDGFLRICRQTQ